MNRTAELQVSQDRIANAVRLEPRVFAPSHVVGVALVEFEVGSATVTTTEDHEFWNVTDQAWQETQHIDPGDNLLTSTGDVRSFCDNCITWLPVTE